MGGAVTVIPPHAAKKLIPDSIFKRPARMVRTDKNQGEGNLHAKSFMVLPGDVDQDGEKPLEDGGIRTDAPMSSQFAFHSFRRTRKLKSFDVSIAFLHGDVQTREIYCRPP